MKKKNDYYKKDNVDNVPFILILDCQHFLPKYVKKLLKNNKLEFKLKYKLLHSSFRFSNNNNAPIFV